MEKAPNTTPLNPEKIKIRHPEFDQYIFELLELLERLEQAYGNKERWKTNHYKHYRMYMDLSAVIAKQETENKGMPADQKCELVLTIAKNEVKKRISHISEVMRSDISHDTKIAIVNDLVTLSETTLEKAEKKIEQVLNPPQKRKSKGRPSKPKSLHAWLFYLKEELGSWNKAYNYASNHPVLTHLGTAESIRRIDNKFRSGGN